MGTMDTVTCSTCGASRQLELSEISERTPCPQCGTTVLRFGALIEESMSVSVQWVTEVIPRNQVRDWKQRWNQVQIDFQLVSTLSTETTSAEAIHAWSQRLFSFFIHAYHLKDALRDAASSLGLTASDIESAISNDQRLAVIADLANLDKHSQLTRPPRSGYKPEIVQISGLDTSAGNGWILSVKIKHGSVILDGIAVARDAVTAWQEKLTSWGVV